MLVKISYRTSLCHIVPNENMQYSRTKYTQFKNKMGNINVSKKYLLIKNIVLHSKKKWHLGICIEIDDCVSGNQLVSEKTDLVLSPTKS